MQRPDGQDIMKSQMILRYCADHKFTDAHDAQILNEADRILGNLFREWLEADMNAVRAKAAKTRAAEEKAWMDYLEDLRRRGALE